MDADALTRQRDMAESNARQLEGEAARYDRLANAAAAELSRKKEQLRKARIARNACSVVKSDNEGFETALSDYGRNLDGALGATSIQMKLLDKRLDNSQLASDAVTAAQRLVDELEAECRMLQSQVTQYRSQASTARSRASSWRTTASNAQRELNKL